MNPSDPLANLHPLREPQIIGWWPLAPGWWVLIAVGLLLIILGLYVAYRRYLANAYRRQGNLQLEQIYQSWQLGKDDLSFVTEVNALLKSTSLKAFARRDIAAKSGAQWIAFLNSTAPALQGGPGSSLAFTQQFSNAAYKNSAEDINCEAIYRSAKAWIAGHKNLERKTPLQSAENVGSSNPKVAL